MKVNKKVLGKLTKCYSIAPLMYKGEQHILVAAEKQDPCYLFDAQGNKADTIWEEPGGVMSMVQVPGSDGVFLATHKFYSPNDSKEAKIVIVSPRENGGWEVRTLVELPHVHRFDIVTRNGVNYLIACALKSGHAYKDDWSMPGKTYAAVLPEDLSCFDEEHQLELTVIKDNMLKNHGYYKMQEKGTDVCLISCDEGVYKFIPPASAEESWEIEKLTDEPGSDAVLVDLDRDGEPELVMISPFHGQNIYILKKKDGAYKKVYTYDTAEFAHAIYGGTLLGEPTVIIGHRKGKRNLLAFTYDEKEKEYKSTVLDQDCGPANVCKYVRDGEEVLISTNREIDEIAMYTFEGE
ncbi:hypothetical protein [Mediterraneibacter massiliensis]|uniref:hypothetical protein n=1 Tax=Mediterraneibacter massiliensis TaxID=1720300 RepID=UPI0024ACF76D|nr:hypothetical protein [Mediterraneibacter massiliensis]